MNTFFDMDGKRILVVGASSGIGKETAVRLSSLGAKVILAARREELLQKTAEELKGSGHACYVCDVSDPAEIEALFQKIKSEQGLLDGLVYCPGVNTTLPLQMLKPEKLKASFEVNFFAFIETVRQATKKGRYNEGMRIAAVSSNAAIRGDKGHTAYSASKAAMNAAVRCLAKELSDKGICINAVSPAMTNTEMYQQYASGNGNINEAEKNLLARQYLGIIEPADVADAIIFLLSPGARMITGIALPVDGGLSTN